MSRASELLKIKAKAHTQAHKRQLKAWKTSANDPPKYKYLSDVIEEVMAERILKLEKEVAKLKRGPDGFEWTKK